MMNRRTALLAVGSLAAAALAGCQSTSKTAAADAKTAKPAAMGVMNTKCPFSGNPVAEGATADFAGQKVGFCCKGCAGKFTAKTDAEKKELVAKVSGGAK